jgi:hypothetical protein
MFENSLGQFGRSLIDFEDVTLVPKLWFLPCKTTFTLSENQRPETAISLDGFLGDIQKTA